MLRDGIPVNTDPQAATINIVSAVQRYAPVNPVKSPDGTYFQDIEFTPGLVNPVALALEPTRRSEINSFLGNFYADYSIVKD
jgi:hypothetical protein